MNNFLWRVSTLGNVGDKRVVISPTTRPNPIATFSYTGERLSRAYFDRLVIRAAQLHTNLFAHADRIHKDHPRGRFEGCGCGCVRPNPTAAVETAVHRFWLRPS